MDAAADGDENASAASWLFGGGSRAGVDSRGTDKGVENNFGVMLQIAVRREWNINDIMRLQRKVLSFTTNDAFIVEDGNLGMLQRAAYHCDMVHVGPIDSAVCARDGPGNG